MIRLRSFIGVAALATLALSAFPSWGAVVSADAFLPSVGAPLGPGASYVLRAFSVEFAPALAGPNAFSFGSLGVAPSVLPIVVFSIPPRVYAPTIVLSGPKGLNLYKGVGSQSPAPPFAPSTVGNAYICTFAVPCGVPLTNPAKSMVATATVPAGVFGAAAGQAVDPYPLSPGSYAYSYTISSLTLSLDDPDDEVGASYFATDSRYSVPLWSLGISADGVLNSNANLSVDFESNPILGLDDGLIDSEVKAAFFVSSGTATLTDFNLFDTTYPVDQRRHRTNSGADSACSSRIRAARLGCSLRVPQTTEAPLILTHQAFPPDETKACFHAANDSGRDSP